MKKKIPLFANHLALMLFCLAGYGFSMEKSFSWTMAPGRGDAIQINLAGYQLSRYLAECEVNRPEIVAGVKSALDSERMHYRESVRDQKRRGTILTVYVDRDHILHIVTHRNETCPDCGGSGTRAKPFGRLSTNVNIRFRCLRCDGEGEIPNFTNERYFSLSSEDFENPEEGRALFADKAYANAPPEAQQWVERLVSTNPRERLAACEWLDSHYVRTGVFFQDIMPMLKKARYYENNEKRKMMVWQFWAGKDIPGERKREYYRIYADAKNGKITRKGFY